MKQQHDDHLDRPFCAITVYPAAFVSVSAITHFAALAWFGCWVHKYASPLAQWSEDVWLLPLIGGASGLIYTIAIIVSSAVTKGRIGNGGIRQHLANGAIAAVAQSVVFIMMCQGIPTVSAWNCLWMAPIGALLVTSLVIKSASSVSLNLK